MSSVASMDEPHRDEKIRMAALKAAAKISNSPRQTLITANTFEKYIRTGEWRR